MKFKPSKYQQKVFDFLLNNNKNAVLNAVAGSGKTTTLLECLKLVEDKETLFLAFNKSIKEELQDRITKEGLNSNINTCHGYGYSILLNHFGNIKINNYKYNRLLNSALNYNIDNDYKYVSDYEFNKDEKRILRKIKLDLDEDDDLNSIKITIISLCNLGRLFLCKNSSEIKNLAEKYNIECLYNEHKLAFYLIKLGLTITDIIDYTDMIFLPIFLKLESPKYDIVFIDECQDLNKAQRILMLKSLKENGRFIAVGDRNQAIYAFSGADSESFGELLKIPNTISLPLNECYRCGENILNEVKDIVPEIEPFNGNPKGTVNHSASINELKSGDMVLCRNTYPLIKLCLKLITENKKATIIGSDIGASLKNLVEKTNKTDMVEVFNVLYADLDVYIKKLMDAKQCTKEEVLESIEYNNKLERIQVIEAIFDKGDMSKDVINKISNIFTPKKTGIILSTIHKAKGLEAKRVFILHRELIPSRFATEPWQVQQEDNLKYVAYTRAKEYLAFVTDFDAFKTAKHESFMDKVSAPKKSKYVGVLYQKYRVIGEVTDVKFLQNYNSMVYTISDEEGNLFEKWGDVPLRFITSKNKTLDVGTKVSMYGVITKHYMFNNVKKNRIGRLSGN